MSQVHQYNSAPVTQYCSTNHFFTQLATTKNQTLKNDMAHGEVDSSLPPAYNHLLLLTEA
jgi:hypothetical protein